jgi:hypothetical protein
MTLWFLHGESRQVISEKIKDKDVYVKKGSIAGAFVSKRNGNPIYKDSLTGNEPLIVAPAQNLEKLGYKISEEIIHKEKISLAAPKGENAFIEKLGAYLTNHGKKHK